MFSKIKTPPRGIARPIRTILAMARYPQRFKCKNCHLFEKLLIQLHQAVSRLISKLYYLDKAKSSVAVRAKMSLPTEQIVSSKVVHISRIIYRNFRFRGISFRQPVHLYLFKLFRN